MNFVGHKIGGITASLILGGISLINGVPLALIGIMMISCFIFSLFPDTGIKSISSKIIYLFGIALAVYLWKIGQMSFLITLVVMLIIPQICKHRGFTHSIVGAVLFSFTWTFILRGLGVYSVSYFSLAGIDFTLITILALVGFLTHFLLDMHFKVL